MTKQPSSVTMRVLHRYLGFFLAGIMAMYALSGIVLIFRDTDAFKKQQTIEKKVEANLDGPALSKALDIRRLSVEREEGNVLFFKDGSYNKSTGEVVYTVKELPVILDKMTHLHKAKSSQPLFFLNIFFGLSLLFFVLSAFWMYTPKTSVFKKGLYFTLAGMILTLVLLFV